MIDLYYGILSLPHSWAVVATNILLQHIKKCNIPFKIYSTNGYTNIHKDLIKYYDYSFVKKIQNGLFSKKFYDVSFSYTLPSNYNYLIAKNRYVIYNYEYSILPNQTTVRHINNHIDIILPSSKFVANCFVNSGVDPSKIRVLPHGYDPELYNDSIVGYEIKEIKDKFKFLCVAIGHYRKGYDVLIEAYCEEFQGEKDVCLILKEGKCNIESVQHYNIDELVNNMIIKYKDKIPTIIRINSYISNMARLYKTADCVVLPTRGEGFCLPALEASVLGIPVIATNYSGHLDFLNHNNAYLIDYELQVSDPRAVYNKGSKNNTIVYWAEPNKEHLQKLMRHVKNNYDEAKKKALLAKNNVKDLTWENVYLQLMDIINKTRK